MLLRLMQNTRRELADAKAENDALRDDALSRWSSSVAHQSSLSVSAWNTIASGVDTQPPPDRIPLNGLFHPQREADHYAKTISEPRSILTSSADRVAHIDGQICAIVKQYTRASSGSINAQSNKTEQSIYECLPVSPQHFLRRHKFWLHRQFSSAQFQKRRNDGWWFLWCYCCRFVLNSKRLLSTSCNTGPAQ